MSDEAVPFIETSETAQRKTPNPYLGGGTPMTLWARLWGWLETRLPDWTADLGGDD